MATQGASVSTITGKLPVLELALPVPVMVPITGTVLLVGPLLLIFHTVRNHYWQTAITGTGSDSIVPFLVLGSASSGIVVFFGPVPELDYIEARRQRIGGGWRERSVGGGGGLGSDYLGNCSQLGG